MNTNILKFLASLMFVVSVNANVHAQTDYADWPKTPDWVHVTNDIQNCYNAYNDRMRAFWGADAYLQHPTFIYPYLDYVNLANNIDAFVAKYHFFLDTSKADSNGNFLNYFNANPTNPIPYWNTSSLHAAAGFQSWATNQPLHLWMTVDHSIQTQVRATLNLMTYSAWGGTFTRGPGNYSNCCSVSSFGSTAQKAMDALPAAWSSSDRGYSYTGGLEAWASIEFNSELGLWEATGFRVYAYCKSDNLWTGIQHSVSWYFIPPPSSQTKMEFSDQGTGIINTMNILYGPTTYSNTVISSTAIGLNAFQDVPTFINSTNTGFSIAAPFAAIIEWNFTPYPMPTMEPNVEDPDTDRDDLVDTGVDLDSFGPDTGGIAFRTDQDLPYVTIPLAATPLWCGGPCIHAYWSQGATTNLPYQYLGFRVQDCGSWLLASNDSDGDGPYQAYSLGTRILDSGVAATGNGPIKRAAVLRPRGNVVIFDFPWNAATSSFSPVGYPMGVNLKRSYFLRDLTPNNNTDFQYDLVFASGIIHRYNGTTYASHQYAGTLSDIISSDGTDVPVFVPTLNDQYNYGTPNIYNIPGGSVTYLSSANNAKYNVSLSWNNGLISQASYTTLDGSQTITTTLSRDATMNIIGLSKTGIAGMDQDYATVEGNTITYNWGSVTRSKTAPAGQSRTVTITANPTGSDALTETTGLNDANRVVSSQITVNGNTSQTTIEYNDSASGRYANGFPEAAKINQITLPTGLTFNRTYDPNTGWLVTETSSLANGLTRTVTYDYSASNGGDAANPSNLVERPRDVTVSVNGAAVAKALYSYSGASRTVIQQCTNTSASWGDSGNLTTMNVYLVGGLTNGLLASSTDPTGSRVNTYTVSGFSGSSFNSIGTLSMSEAKSSGFTLTNTVNAFGYQSGMGVFWAASSALQPISSISSSCDSFGRPLLTSYSDGTTENFSSYCLWGPQQVTRRDLSFATIQYDALGHVSEIDATSPSCTTTINTDPLGLDTTFSSVQGGVTRTTHFVHDLMGRPLTHTDPLGNTTTWVYTPTSDGWSVSITPPSGGLGTVTEEHYFDGSLKAVYGLGAPKCFGNTWSIQNGNLCEIITALNSGGAPLNEQTVVTFNALNLPASIQQAGIANAASIIYDSAARPNILTDASGITSILNYAPAVGIQQAGVKLGGDFTTLDPANDRMASYQLAVGSSSETRSANVYPAVGLANLTTLSSITRSYDGLTVSSTFAGRTAMAQASTFTAPGTYSVNASLPNGSSIQAAFGPLGLTSYSLLDSQNGLNTSATITPDPGGLSVQGNTSSGSFSDTYNLLGLLTSHDATGSGGGYTSIQYLNGTDLPTLIASNGKVFSCQYCQNGLPYQISQSGSPTVYCGWDFQGRLASLTTWQNGQASVTSWDRDPYTGRLADKKVNGVVVASYSWKPNGQFDTLTRGDGSTLQYQYNVAGDLINTLDVATNGTLETINTSCDRMGHALSASVAGGISESYACGIDGSLQGVQVAGNGVVPNYTLSLPQNSASGLPLGFSATGPAFSGGSGRNLAVSYDAASRTAGITDGAINAAYGWTSGNSAAFMTVAVNGTSALIVSNTWNESLGVRTGIAWLLPNGTPVASFAFSRNPGTNLITDITREDGSSRIIAYDTTNQLLSSTTVLPNNTIDETRSYAYAYDGSGNMIQGGRVGPSGEGRDSFTANGFNFQIVRTWNAVDLVGVASTNAHVTVNGIPTTRAGTRFVASIPLTSGSAACATTLVVGAVVSTGSNTENYAEAVVPLRLPACPESIQTSLAGTTVSDSLSEYLYDAHNQLRCVTDNVGNPRLQSVYDYYSDGRRARKTVSIWTNGAWQVSSVHQYIYDQWNLIREISSNCVGTATRDYTWGVDLSGMQGGARGQESGGIGGLVAITEVVSRNQMPGVTNILLPVCDQVGTVVALVAAVTNNVTLATPAVVATYEYTPFGDLISADGSYAHSCPFGFSSKYRDRETEFLYYGHRYYDPRCGKWLTNDPLEENGGINMTAICGNDPVNNVDALGLEIDIYEESGWTPRGYSPYYYGTTIPETAFAQLLNLGSLINNSFWVGLQSLNVAMERTGINDIAMAMPMTGAIAKAPAALVEVEEIAQAGQAINKVAAAETTVAKAAQVLDKVEQAVSDAGGAWKVLPGGVRIKQVGNYWVKDVNPDAAAIAQWWGRGALNAQAKALGKLGDMAPSYLFKDGKLISRDVGVYTPGSFWRTWLNGSLRLGTPFNDIRPRNIGANGVIFDPAKHPVQQGLEAGAAGLGIGIGGFYLYDELRK